MVLSELKKELKELSRSEKFALIQYLVGELSQEEIELVEYFESGESQTMWSKNEPHETTLKLQSLIDPT